MTENEASSGEQGSEELSGRPSDQALQALPAKVRVHALARIVGSSSREMLAVLARLGVGARSAQSSIDRDTVAQVVDDLFPSETPAVDIVPPADDATPAAEALDPAGLAEPTLDLEAPAARTSAPASSAVPAPMFLAPGAESAPSRPRRRRASRSSGVVTPTLDEAADETAEEPDAVEAPAAPPTSDDEAGDSTETGDGTAGDGEDDDEGARRRRRRGRRGRGRGRGSADEGGEGEDTDENDGSGDGDAATDASDEGSDDDADGSDDGEGADDDASSSGSRRRRRRRRRSSEGGGDSSEGSNGSNGPDDPPDTVTHVRDRTEKPEKSASDEVKGVKGSTRLEAKRQRRRDGRDQGRRRPPILSESEFLARREAVERTMIVRQQAGRSQIGVLEDGVLVEHFVAGEGQNSMVGNVYLGRVQNVLPSMEAAFVDIGRGRNAVLYAGEVNWDASGLEGKQRKIEQALSSGDQVLVQVTKDPVGHKGARLTTQISLPGRFLVFVPAGGATGISRKLPDNERKRLKEILKRIVPDESGVIIRTAAEGISEADLERDVNRLTAQWEVIERKASEAKNAKGTAPTLVYEEPDLLIRVVRDMFNEDFASLVVSGGRAFDTLEGYLSHVAPELSARMTRHTAPQDVFAAYRVDEQLAKALDRKVWLPSGGTLVIDRTEAMTVVDVNTGKFTGSGGNLEETVTRNNLEAAEEVVRQLRLRDIGGMIVIDFIDMVLESNRDLVLRRLTECLGRDRTRHQVSEVTSLGLVQMTRKRVGQGLLDEFSTTCEHCRGRGVIVSTEPVIGDQHGHGGGQGPSQQAAAGNGQSSGNGGGSGNGNGSDKGNGSEKGSGSGRRRGRGRRGAQSDGGSPSEVAPGTETTTETATEDDETPGTTGSAPEAVAADAVATDEVRVEAEVQEDEAQESTPEPAGSEDSADSADSAADEVPVVAQATTEEVALETDLAEHSGAAGEAGESAATAASGEAEDESATPVEEPAPAGESTSVAESTPVVESVVEPTVAAVEPTESAVETPVEAPAEEKPAARPRRRRAASRPAGPPAAGDAAASDDPATRVEAASVSVGGS